MSFKLLDLTAARLSLGFIEPGALPEAAARILGGENFKSPSLEILAGLSFQESHDSSRLFEQALVELDREIPCEIDAAILLARAIAQDILDKKVSCFEGAKSIWEISLAMNDNTPPSEFDTFIYAASEWQDRPEARHIFESGILDSAEELVGSSSLRSGAKSLRRRRWPRRRR